MKTIVIRLLSGLLMLIYLATAGLKFMNAPNEVALFALFGYPIWFMYVVGVLEAVCAVGLFVPRFATVAALLLACDMIGATVSHLTHGQLKMSTLPIFLLILLIVLVSLRGGLKLIGKSSLR